MKVGAEPTSRGRPECIGVKKMPPEERKAYDAERQRLSRTKKKATAKDNQNKWTPESGRDDEEEMKSSEEEEELNVDKARAILNIIANSPIKKQMSERRLADKVKDYLKNFNNAEKVDIMNVLVHALKQETRTRLGEIGMEVKDNFQ